MNRVWSALAKYEGKEPFHFGSVSLQMAAKQHEIEAALAELWAEISPHPAPKFDPVPGMVIFVPEGDV